MPEAERPHSPAPQAQKLDPAAAWEEKRRSWLIPSSRGRGLSGSSTTFTKLSKLSTPKTEAEAAAADRAITIIKNRLADKQNLREPMPLSILVSLLYRSWFLDGTITQQMVDEAKGAVDTDADLVVGESQTTSALTAEESK